MFSRILERRLPMFKLRTLFMVLLLLGTGSQVAAQACAGVEGRVNNRTSQVSSAVTTLIATRQAAIITQEIVERQRMLSAIRVLTKQMSVSGEQEVVADRSSNLALSQTVVQQSVNTQIREAVRDYGNTGHNACGIVERGQVVADMIEEYNSVRDEMANTVASNRTAATEDEFRSQLSDWNALVQGADDATIAAVLNGDETQADAFIAVVAGPPRPPIQAGSDSVLSKQDRVIALQQEARTSAAVLVLADIAASQRVQTALDAMTSEWIGDDGGAAWAASMAASPARAVMLDTVRIDAQTIASTALELKRSVMEEFALAAFAVTYAERMQRESLQ